MNLFFITFFVSLIVIIDQFLKYFITLNIKYVDKFTLIPNLLDLVYVENKGAAFGIFQNQRWFFIIFTFIMLSVFIYLFLCKKIQSKFFTIAAILIVGGGIGNIIDRLFLGYVVDYLKLSFFPPVCNFADYCITIGAIILFAYILFFYKEENTVLMESKNI